MTQFEYDYWKINFNVFGRYRNYVILHQINNPIKGRIPLLMLNPGSFINKKSFAKDLTLRNVRRAFDNSGYEIEILNLFNYSEPKRKKLLNNEKLNYNNSLLERLSFYDEGAKVIIQWGKLEAYAKKRAEEVLSYIKMKKLIPISFKNEIGTCYHPRCWSFDNRIQKFREEILPQI